MWQEIIVALCIFAAAYFLLRQWLPFGKKKSSGCGSCSTGCGTSTSTSKDCDTSAK